MPVSGLNVSWKGSFSALVTPFTRDGSLDEAAIRANARTTVREGAHGVMVAGQYGEGHMLSEAERERVLALTAEEVGGRVPVIAATSGIATREVIARARAAKAAGADGAMVEPPAILLPSDDEVFGHFARLADAVDMPIMLCNSPKRVGIDLHTDLVERLCAIPNVLSIKHSGTDFHRIMELLERLRHRIAVFIGPSRLFGLPGVLMGAAGFMDGLSQVVGGTATRLYDFAVARDLDEAVPLQRRLFVLGEIIYSRFGTPPASTKDAMRLLGRPGGWPRPPLRSLDPEGIVRLQAALAALGFERNEADVEAKSA